VQKLVYWLYSGKVELEKEWQRLEWMELISMLGIGGEKEIQEGGTDEAESWTKNIPSGQKEKKVDKSRGKKYKSENLLVKSLKNLNLDDSYKMSGKKPFCDVDIFTSDDDSFVMVEDEKNTTEDKDNISSCIQCDLSDDEEHEKSETIPDSLEIFDNSSKSDESLANSSGSDFQDATASLGVKSNYLVVENVEEYNDRNRLDVKTSIESRNNVKADPNETVYEDCEEEMVVGHVDNCPMEGDNEDVSDGDDTPDKTVTEGEDGSNLSLELECSNNASNFEDDDIEEDNDPDESSVDEDSDNDSSWNESGSDTSDNSDEERKVSRKSQNPMYLGDITDVNFSTVNTSVLGVWLSETGPVHMDTRCLCKGTCVRNCACRTAGGMCSRRCSCKPSKCKLRAAVEMKESSQSTDTHQPGNLLGEKTGEEDRKCEVVLSAFLSPNLPSEGGMCSKSDLSIMTPSCPPIPLSASTSMLDTTTKRRMKKLFTETVGPQEM